MNKILNSLMKVKQINEKFGVLKYLAPRYPWLGYVDVGLGLTSLLPDLYLSNVKNKIISSPNFCRFHRNEKGSPGIDELKLNLFCDQIFPCKIETIEISETVSCVKILRENIELICIKEKLYDTTYYVYSVSDLILFNNWIKKITREKYGLRTSLFQNKLKKETEDYCPSNLTSSIYKEIQQFKVHNIGRSYLLLGRPGSGKSNLAKSIGISSGEGCLFLKDFADAVRTGFINNIANYISLLNFSFIIIDDFDHAGIQGFLDQIFDAFETLKELGKTIIVTANSVASLHPAMIRPGRFDKIIRIDTLEPEAVLNMVGGDLELFEEFKEQPAANIAELMKRVKVFGKEIALSQKEEIFNRSSFQE